MVPAQDTPGVDMSREESKDGAMANNNVVPLEEAPQSVQAQAAAWLAILDGDDPAPEDIQAFKRWVNEAPAHIAAFEKVAAAWDRLNILTRLPLALEQKELKRRRDSEQSLARAMPFPARYIALAASVVLMMVIALNFSASSPDHASYFTAVGEQKTITLPDNSVVQLNTNSRIKFDYRGTERAIYLYQGEAHFSVAKNPSRPFEVFAGAGRVRAVGTAFSVALSSRSDDINVLVNEGVVDVAPDLGVPGREALPEDSGANSGEGLAQAESPAPGNQRVSAGHVVVFDRLAVQAVQLIADDEMQRRLAWKKGLLVFSGEPLEEVVSQISRYTDTRIVIQSDSARQLRIGGQFQVTDMRALFSALEQGFGLNVEYATDSLVYLSDKNNSSE